MEDKVIVLKFNPNNSTADDIQRCIDVIHKMFPNIKGIALPWNMDFTIQQRDEVVKYLMEKDND